TDSPTAARPTFNIVALVFQCVLIVLFGVLVDYGKDVLPPANGEPIKYDPLSPNNLQIFHGAFQDIHILVFVGIGFLISFMKKYGYSGVGNNFFAGALICEWSVIMFGVFNDIIIGGKKTISIDIKTTQRLFTHLHVLFFPRLIYSDFAAATVLISYCCVLGKISRLQLLVMGIFETFLYYLNDYICYHHLKIADAGGSIVLHIFACYFGLGVAWMIYKEYNDESGKDGPSYQSDMFAMVGTLILWVFWPTFNGILVAPDYIGQHRALVNTYFSLTGACVMTFVVSPLIHKDYKLSMAHVQNSTLAGGVVMGAICNLLIQPYVALLLGSIAGVVCTLGCYYLTPFLHKSLKLHDVCGVHNLHGIPGIIAGVAGAVAVVIADAKTYGYEGLFTAWGSLAPEINSTEYFILQSKGYKFNPGIARTVKSQAAYQVAAIFITIGISLVGGLITGWIMNLRICDPITERQLFDDEDFWEVK
ncbi:hypothetical protein QZH41_017119, partial [Actinostola sp. cb2023]